MTAIIRDTITVDSMGNNLYYVTACVTDSTRENGKYVSILWNEGAGISSLRDRLIEAFEGLLTNKAALFQTQIRQVIGTDIPIVEPESSGSDQNVTINAASVTVNGG